MKITTDDNHKEYNLIYQKVYSLKKKLVSENSFFQLFINMKTHKDTDNFLCHGIYKDC
jgi:hypothetical protein